MNQLGMLLKGGGAHTHNAYGHVLEWRQIAGKGMVVLYGPLGSALNLLHPSPLSLTHPQYVVCDLLLDVPQEVLPVRPGKDLQAGHTGLSGVEEVVPQLKETCAQD